MSDKKVILIGAGGFGKEVAWLAETCGHTVTGFLDDNPDNLGKIHYGFPILGSSESWKQYSDHVFVFAIGSPRVKKKILQKMEALGKPEFINLIHPSVHYSNTVSMGMGNVICAGSILTTDIKLGNHTTINLSATVGHDVVMGDFTTLAPQASISGNVTFEGLNEVGTCAVIRQGITLARGSMLGMGGVLTKNLEKHTVAVGNPARAMKKLEEV